MDRYNCKWPLWFAPKDITVWAVTIGQTTYYSVPKNQVGAAWQRHEDKHKEQWRRDGVLKFAIKYLWYQLRYGYQDNPYEVEAKAAE